MGLELEKVRYSRNLYYSLAILFGKSSDDTKVEQSINFLLLIRIHSLGWAELVYEENKN
jgi:hypothetical protein